MFFIFYVFCFVKDICPLYNITELPKESMTSHAYPQQKHLCHTMNYLQVGHHLTDRVRRSIKKKMKEKSR